MFKWVLSAASVLIMAHPVQSETSRVVVDPTLQSGAHPTFPTKGWVRVSDPTARALNWPYGCEENIGDTSYVRCPNGQWSTS